MPNVPASNEAMIQNHLGKTARYLAGALGAVLLMLTVLYMLWLVKAIELSQLPEEALRYSPILFPDQEFAPGIRFYPISAFVLRTLFAFIFIGWILTFLRWGYHVCARARQIVPGAIRQRPGWCVIWLLIPGVNIWMTYLVLRAAKRIRSRDAVAAAPRLTLLLSFTQAINLISALAEFCAAASPASNATLLACLPDYATLELIRRLIGTVLPLFSYALFFALLGRLVRNETVNTVAE